MILSMVVIVLVMMVYMYVTLRYVTFMLVVCYVTLRYVYVYVGYLIVYLTALHSRYDSDQNNQRYKPNQQPLLTNNPNTDPNPNPNRNPNTLTPDTSVTLF